MWLHSTFSVSNHMENMPWGKIDICSSSQIGNPAQDRTCFTITQTFRSVTGTTILKIQLLSFTDHLIGGLQRAFQGSSRFEIRRIQSVRQMPIAISRYGIRSRLTHGHAVWVVRITVEKFPFAKIGRA